MKGKQGEAGGERITRLYTIQDRNAQPDCRTVCRLLASRNKKRSTTAAARRPTPTTPPTMIDRCSCRAASVVVASRRRSSRSVRGSARVTRREEMGNWTRRSRVARAIRAPSGPQAPDSTVPRTSQRDYSCPLWSRCADCALAVLSSGDGHLPPRSFLRDRPSSRCEWSRIRRCADTRRPGAIVGCRSCPSGRGNRTHPGTGTAFPWALAVVFSSSLSASGASEAAAPTPALRKSLPPGAVVSAPVLTCCNVEKRDGSSLLMLPSGVSSSFVVDIYLSTNKRGTRTSLWFNLEL